MVQSSLLVTLKRDYYQIYKHVHPKQYLAFNLSSLDIPQRPVLLDALNIPEQVVYVVDAADSQRFQESRKVLEEVILQV
jgi:hypothetical protein